MSFECYGHDGSDKKTLCNDFGEDVECPNKHFPRVLVIQSDPKRLSGRTLQSITNGAELIYNHSVL